MNREKILLPVLQENYVNVFCPSGNTYAGPNGIELEKGKYYEEWVPNDHGFIQDTRGYWHIFGITHPLTSVKNIHEGEVQLFHAMTDRESFINLTPGMFKDKGCILTPDERPGEPIEIHSPYIIKTGDIYNMIYGPTQFRLAQSLDLKDWVLKGVLFHDGEGASRDPQIMMHGDSYYLCYCSGNEVRMRQSQDLYSWSDYTMILKSPDGINPESPFLLNHEGMFYLFVCTWQGKLWDRKDVSGAYQHKTLVYAAENIDNLGKVGPITELNAHAPEIIKVDNQYLISSAEWPFRGINMAKIEFR